MTIPGHNHSLLLLFAVLLSLGACRVGSNDDTDIVVTADPEFVIDLFEARNPADGTPAFGLWVESVKLYDCTGYGIDAAVQIQNNRIEVDLLGAIPASPCSGDPAPAKQFLPIGALADGSYEFAVSLRDVIINEGVLTVAAGQYSLSLADPQGVDFQNLVLSRLPDGIIWGYADTPDELSEPVADNFIFDLKTLSAEAGLSPGYYSYFTVTGAGSIYFHKSIAPAGAAELFARRLTASPDALKSLLQNYRNAAQQPLHIRCWTTEGEF